MIVIPDKVSPANKQKKALRGFGVEMWSNAILPSVCQSAFFECGTPCLRLSRVIHQIRPTISPITMRLRTREIANVAVPMGTIASGA
jgi:hypothetical protein